MNEGNQKLTSGELLQLIKAGESETVEFKKSLHKDIRRSILSFANDINENKKGYLIIGVSDNGIPIGIDGNIDAAQRKIADIARDQCTPPINISVQLVSIDNKKLLIVEIQQSPHRPHFEGKCYIRIDGENRPADEREIEQLINVRNSKYALIMKCEKESKLRKVTVQPWKGENDRATCYIRELKNHSVLLEFHGETYEPIIALDGLTHIRKLPAYVYPVTYSVPLEDIKISDDPVERRCKFILNNPLEKYR